MPVDVSNPSYVVLTHNQATATVYYFGATLTSWTVDGNEKLFVCTKAILDGTKPIRGGIPIAFPQFGVVEGSPLPQHGFARNSIWEFKGTTVDSANETSVEFALTPEKVPEEIFNLWGKQFKAIYTVSISDGQIRTSLQVKNTDKAPWNFTALLHTYFDIHDISKIGVTGLKGYGYTDKVQGGLKVLGETNNIVTVSSEVDRVYTDVSTDQISIVNHETKDSWLGLRTNLPDVVVWNAWVDKAKALVDMGDEDYKRYICVEFGAVGKPVTLQPGDTWEGYQIFNA